MNTIKDLIKPLCFGLYKIVTILLFICYINISPLLYVLFFHNLDFLFNKRIIIFFIKRLTQYKNIILFIKLCTQH